MKTIHTAKAEKKDPKLEIKKRLMNYRNTPHPATGKAPAELVFRQTVKTKIPRKLKFLISTSLANAEHLQMTIHPNYPILRIVQMPDLTLSY